MNEYWDEQDEAARAERLASEPAQEWDDWAMHSELTAPPHMPKRWRMTITVAGEGASSSSSVHLTRERERWWMMVVVLAVSSPRGQQCRE